MLGKPERVRVSIEGADGYIGRPRVVGLSDILYFDVFERSKKQRLAALGFR